MLRLIPVANGKLVSSSLRLLSSASRSKPPRCSSKDLNFHACVQLAVMMALHGSCRDLGRLCPGCPEKPIDMTIAVLPHLFPCKISSELTAIRDLVWYTKSANFPQRQLKCSFLPSSISMHLAGWQSLDLSRGRLCSAGLLGH